MKSTQYIPCVCTNPSCGYSFMMRNPFMIQGKNNIVVNSSTNCPKCGSNARMADQGTDSHGRHYINTNNLVSFIRGINELSKLEKIRATLESRKDKIQAEDLVKNLSEIDPEFSRFKNFIKSIKGNTLILFIGLLLQIITLLIELRDNETSEKQFEENLIIEKEKIELIREDLELDREKFEYQKQKDREEKLASIERKLEKLVNESNDQTALKTNVKNKSSSNHRYPNLKNLCPCGSGKKAEECHPFGLIFPIKRY